LDEKKYDMWLFWRRWAGSFDRKSTTGFCTSVGGNLVTWKSKKQNVVARSSAEAKYRAMAWTASELTWIKQVLVDLKTNVNEPMKMFCDNQAAWHIASNPVFHERTKHIEEIELEFVKSEDQLANIFTKGLSVNTFNNISNKPRLYDLYHPSLRGSVEKWVN
jgi:hypothetical protein